MKDMEDVFKFLFVIAIIAVGFIRQAKKEAKKKAADSPAMPRKENPLPESWNDGTYGGYIPEGPQPEVAVISPKKNDNRKSSKSKPTHTTGTLSDRIDSSSNYNSPPTATSQEAEEQSEFEIHSVEEARRAIVWSEILKRKY